MKNGKNRSWHGMAMLACGVLLLAGCQSLAITALGVGASAGVQQTTNGVTYRTFTAPAPRVQIAALDALKRMGIKIDAREKLKNGERITASAQDREIEIEFEKITDSTTRMSAVAKNGMFSRDTATATEIIVQTGKYLGNA